MNFIKNMFLRSRSRSKEQNLITKAGEKLLNGDHVSKNDNLVQIDSEENDESDLCCNIQETCPKEEKFNIEIENKVDCILINDKLDPNMNSQSCLITSDSCDDLDINTVQPSINNLKDKEIVKYENNIGIHLDIRNENMCNTTLEDVIISNNNTSKKSGVEENIIILCNEMGEPYTITKLNDYSQTERIGNNDETEDAHAKQFKIINNFYSNVNVKDSESNLTEFKTKLRNCNPGSSSNDIIEFELKSADGDYTNGGIQRDITKTVKKEPGTPLFDDQSLYSDVLENPRQVRKDNDSGGFSEEIDSVNVSFLDMNHQLSEISLISNEDLLPDTNFLETFSNLDELELSYRDHDFEDLIDSTKVFKNTQCDTANVKPQINTVVKKSNLITVEVAKIQSIVHNNSEVVDLIENSSHSEKDMEITDVFSIHSSDSGEDNIPLSLFKTKNNDIEINDSNSSDDLNSFDFEFITETEAKKVGLYTKNTVRLKRKDIKSRNTMKTTISVEKDKPGCSNNSNKKQIDESSSNKALICHNLDTKMCGGHKHYFARHNLRCENATLNSRQGNATKPPDHLNISPSLNHIETLNAAGHNLECQNPTQFSEAKIPEDNVKPVASEKNSLVANPEQFAVSKVNPNMNVRNRNYAYYNRLPNRYRRNIGEVIDFSYRTNHVIPQGNDYLELFQGLHEPAVPMFIAENKSVYGSTMNVQFDGIGFDMRMAERFREIDDVAEHGRDAKDTTKKILSLEENRRKRRRH